MPDIQEIIRRIVSSQAKFAILKLFKENPCVMDNRFGLSLWVGRPEELLAPELEELIQMGVIHRWGTEPGAIYAYTRDKELRLLIEEHWDEISLASEAERQQKRAKTEQSPSCDKDTGCKDEDEAHPD